MKTHKRKAFAITAGVKSALWIASLLASMSATPVIGQTSLPLSFDSLGPTVQSLTTDTGRTIHFVDDGYEDGLPVVFTGGLGTSVRVIRLLDFLETMRRDLKLRFITVERNGFGQTEFDDSLTMTDYVSDVETVLSHLQIDRDTAKIAERHAGRILSVHMAATSPAIGNPQRCSNGRSSPYAEMLRYPMRFFGFPENSPLHRIKGFQDTAYDEAARARGQSAELAPLLHELTLYCTEPPMDSGHITAPVYVYLGLQDRSG